MLSLLMALWSW